MLLFDFHNYGFQGPQWEEFMAALPGTDFVYKNSLNKKEKMISSPTLNCSLQMIDKALRQYFLVFMLQPFYFPDNAGYPIGGDDGFNFFMIQIHYDNPSHRSGNSNSVF